MKSSKKTTRKCSVKTVEMLFTTPVSFKVNGQTISKEDGNLFLEILNVPPVFTSNIELYEKLCETINKSDWDDLEMAAGLLADPQEKDWFKSYLIDYYLGEDTSRY